MMGYRTSRYDSIRSDIVVEQRHLDKARRMLQVGNYDKKVADVMAVMAGKRLTKQVFGDIVDRG
jgi:hypothetical protein